MPLSDLGFEQARATGRWFAELPDDERPQVILSSPYVRARQTAKAICEAGALAGGPAKPIVDERLREREFGIFDRLTTAGIRARYPEEAEHRAMLGKFYHRPPGGESWADVILRLRSAMNTINLHYSNKRVLVVCHQVVVLCMRYILEELEESEILGIDKQADVLNCGICAYDFEPDAGRAVRAHPGDVEPRRADGRGRRAEDRRAGHDDRVAMSKGILLDRKALEAFPLPRSRRATSIATAGC